MEFRHLIDYIEFFIMIVYQFLKIYIIQVDQIVLISGDSDFVSAAKLARREGIDFILDPLGAPVKPDLFEHIDGLRTCDSNFKISDKK